MALAAKKGRRGHRKISSGYSGLVINKFAEGQYQKEQTGAQESQLDMCRRIHFGFDGHAELKRYCDEIGIEYLSTPFDLPSIDFPEYAGPFRVENSVR